MLANICVTNPMEIVTNWENFQIPKVWGHDHHLGNKKICWDHGVTSPPLCHTPFLTNGPPPAQRWWRASSWSWLCRLVVLLHLVTSPWLGSQSWGKLAQPCLSGKILSWVYFESIFSAATWLPPVAKATLRVPCLDSWVKSSFNVYFSISRAWIEFRSPHPLLHLFCFRQPSIYGSQPCFPLFEPDSVLFHCYLHT